jgi:23S rRNA-/tRNA-specific pseudouridylate synthase
LITILKQDQTWLAVEKPAGLPTQAPPDINSLEHQLRAQLAGSVAYLAIPHRLDVPVSGVVLVARTKKAARLLSEQFAARKVSKTYHAIVGGDASGIETTWNDEIRKIPDQPRVEIALSGASDAKSAVTTVQQADFDAASDRTRLILNPQTGRMHQLRIGAASRGFPIIGDSIYGNTSDATIQLRAIAIEFHDPSSGKRTKVSTDPLPWP